MADEDFERFLQKDDSESTSSSVVSPTIKNNGKSSIKLSKSASKQKTATSKTAVNSALSVVAAAEKLLAASGRGGRKKSINTNEEDEPPPPSYDADPYSFDMESSYLLHSKTHEGKKPKKKDKRKEKSVAELPKRTMMTLDERIADILKRTGGTTFLARKEEEHEDVAEHSDTIPLTKHDESDQDKELDHGDGLSFSDSLGMESADFEVGTHAKRKLERSRLSLSSLNSEKFAVNTIAVEESEQLGTPSRYDNPLSQNTHEDSDATSYQDDEFELDQTTTTLADPWTISQPKTEENVSGFKSEFEKMKALFTLQDEEMKPFVSENDVQSSQQVPETKHTTSLMDSIAISESNFGYEDDDFEAEGSMTPKEDAQNAFENEHDQQCDKYEQEIDNTVEVEHGDEEQGNDNKKQVDDLLAKYMAMDTAPAVRELPIEMKPPLSENIEAKNTHPTMVSTRNILIQPHSTKVERPFELKENDQAYRSQISPMSPPPPPPDMSPPPPPPDELDPFESFAPHQHIDKQNQHNRAAMHTSESRQQNDNNQSSVPPLTTNPVTSVTTPHQSFDENRYESEPSSGVDLVAAANLDEEKQRAAREMRQEMQQVEALLEQARQAREIRRQRMLIGARSSTSNENSLLLQLQQAQRQIFELKNHVQQFATEDADDIVVERGKNTDYGTIDAGDENLTVDKAGGDVLDKKQRPGKGFSVSADTVPRELYNKLEIEMKTQERLIQGYQRENEQLMKQLKQVQRDIQYDVHRTNEALIKQVHDLRATLDSGAMDTTHGSAYHVAVEARLRAEAYALSLQEDLETMSHQHQRKLHELMVELETIKKAKIQLECKYEGVDLDKIQQDAQQIQLLQKHEQLKKTEYEHSMRAMQTKLDWYIENQRLVDEQDEKITSLRTENTQLKAQINQIMSESRRSPAKPSTVSSSMRSPVDIRRIHELENRLSEMEEAMRKRHPDSLVSLIATTRKADDASTLKEQSEAHAKERQTLEEEIERIRTTAETKLISFRQQQDKLVAQYEKQIAALEARVVRQKEPTRAVRSTAATTARRAATAAAQVDEKELNKVRRFYTDKIKELERKWEAKLQALKRPGGVESTTITSMEAARMISTLQNQVKTQEVELSKLRATATNVDANTNHEELDTRVSSLEQELRASEDARRLLIETMNSLPATPFPPPPLTVEMKQLNQSHQPSYEHEVNRILEQHQEQLRNLHKEHDASLASAHALIASLTQQLEAQSSYHQQAMASHQATLSALQAQLTSANQEKHLLQELASTTPILEAEVQQLREQLASPQTPSMLQFRSLELKIETLTQKHQVREQELRVLLEQATQSNLVVIQKWKYKYETMLQEKNKEIQSFQQQVKEMMDELELFREHHVL